MAIIEKKLEEFGITLTLPGKPDAPILFAKQADNLLYISGHGSRMKGKVGENLTVEDGYAAAREAAIRCIATMKKYLGDLDRVKNIIKVFGMVNSAPDFTQQPAVINGASELLIAVFGTDAGYHARSAVGMASLPSGIAVEVEMIVEVA